MQVQLRHSPSFTVARAFLSPHEQIKLEGGAMMAHSAGMTLEARSEGGIMAGLKRSVLAGESFFVTTYTAPGDGGWLDMAGVLPGDIAVIDVTPDRPYYLAKGNWIANASTVTVDTQFGGMSNLFGGEGGFGLRANGSGPAVVSVYGAIDVFDLQPGQQVTIDTGHVVAYELNIRFSMRKAAAGILNSLKSGEGWVFDFTGPGRVLLQTRNPSAFAQWAGSVAPGSNPKGGLGGVFGR
ncbi:TIGR00266 family protein [Nakamurella leprariae]|uniref:TIGR00266 family protein n=1 Tax=Nakamurella leprariae TaxID=2803911 RepID=A0A938YH31_9ACTN|nr:TIGR00266 family protein [Nakamurella leprariae]MBM9469483.1 TIGR00266 family protein [Nakamurella leprariae]